MMMKWHGTNKEVSVTEKREEEEGKSIEKQKSIVRAATALKANSGFSRFYKVLYTIEMNIKENCRGQGSDSKWKQIKSFWLILKFIPLCIQYFELKVWLWCKCKYTAYSILF